MVKVGDFSLELVDATTKVPFKEHVAPSDGQFYAEVEPGLDYFISVGNDRGGVRFDYKVDGVDLGYHTKYHRPKQNEYRGNRSRTNGVTQITSFRFNIAQTRSESGGQDDSSPEMMTGKVELIIHELGDVTYEIPKPKEKKDRTKQAEALEANSKLGDAKMKGKKCLVSTAGSVPLNESSNAENAKATKAEKPKAKYSKGKYITTLTLNYCSTVGLIMNKILDPPPEEKKKADPPIVDLLAVESDEEEIKQEKKRAKTEKKKGERMI